MYELSAGSFIVGLLILAAGVALMRWHQWAGDNFGSGYSSYERYKFWAIVACVLGFIVMVNLHTVILRFLIGLILP
jgi:uncharacterized membrane protein YidH (DUF202 family)